MLKHILLISAILVSACGNKSSEPQQETLSTLQEYIWQIAPNLPYCQYNPDFKGISKDTCVSEHTGEGDGDMILFAGLLCASGEPLGCETARRSIDSIGRIWRSPGRINNDSAPTASRDMMLGALLYLTATKDVDSANKVLQFIESNNNRLCFDRCDLPLSFWGNFYEVWHYLGLEPTTKMKQGRYLDDIGQGVAAIFNEGYSLHLIGVTLYLREKTGSTSWTTRIIAKQLLSKQPDNPFFRFLVEGKSRGTLDSVLRKRVDNPLRRDEWIWERSTSDVTAYARSMGWDFVFMYNLLAR